MWGYVSELAQNEMGEVTRFEGWSHKALAIQIEQQSKWLTKNFQIKTKSDYNFEVMYWDKQVSYVLRIIQEKIER